MRQKYTKLALALIVLFILTTGNASAFQVIDTDEPPTLTLPSGSEEDTEEPPTMKFGDNPTPPANCTDNTTKENDTKICQNDIYITCNASKENFKTKDLSKQCKNGKWVNTDDDDNDDDDLTPPDGDNTTIKITKVSAYPKGLHPSINSSKIYYTLSKEATLEIRISDHTGQTIIKLIDDQKVEAGDHFITWYGTQNNVKEGTALKNGTYKFKIIAKNPKTGDIEDTEEGEINLSYQSPPTPPVTTGTGQTATGKVSGEAGKNQAKATQTLQNSTTGKTAKTGPGVLIYFLFPLAGYFISRKK